MKKISLILSILLIGSLLSSFITIPTKGISDWNSPKNVTINGGSPPSISDDGSKIAFQQSDGFDWEIFVINSDGSGLTQLTDNIIDDFIPSISGDGSKIVFCSQVEENEYELFVINSDGTDPIQITNHNLGGTKASICSDGSKVAFISYTTGGLAISIVNSDGSGLNQIATTNAWGNPSPCISGDGSKIAFLSELVGTWGIFVVNSDGSGLIQLSNNAVDNSYPSISGGGSKITFSSYVDDDYEIFVINSDGSGLIQLTSNTASDRYPSISGDGSKITFQSEVDGDSEIFIVNSDGSGLAQLTSNTVFDGYPCISRNGFNIAFLSNGNIFLMSSQLQDLDTDGDGLLDVWEINGIDTDGDWKIDLDLAGLGADPSHKDIFVEVDWMAGHSPSQSAINDVKLVFANKGINLYVELSNVVDHTQFITFDRQPGDQNTVDFDDIKAANFDSNRRQAFHYCIFAHRQKEDPISSGIGEIVGNDFIVTLGETHFNEANQIGTFMHELGHNLGLLHGGDENTNHKPNYISNMNYLFQFGIKQENGLPVFDWSLGTLPDLFELNLNEELGVQGGDYYTGFIDPSNPIDKIYVMANGPIDWNQNGDIEPWVIENINNDVDEIFGFPILWFLHDHNDWGNLNFRFQDNADNFADGVHLDVIDPSDEIDYYESLLIVSSMYSPVDSLETMKVLIGNMEENKFIDSGNVLAKKKALIKKIDEVIMKINEGLVDEAVDKLTKDIKSKMDGNPKPKDWISDINAQNTFCSIVDNIINQFNP